MVLKTDIAGIDEILQGVEQFVDSAVLPLERSNHELLSNPRRLYGDDGRFAPEVRGLMREVRQRSSEAGYFGMCVPEELGGGGQGALLHYLTWERVFRRFGPTHLPMNVLAHWARGPSHIFLEASEEVRSKVVPRLMSGEETMCFSLSEPDAGSDAWNLRTSATRTDDGWVLNGTKQWSTNGPTADYAMVFAVTDRDRATPATQRVTAFLVPATTPGYRVDSVVSLFGAPGGDEAIISLTDALVPDAYRVGEVGAGFSLALSGISLGRMYNAGRAVGMGRWALEAATRYATERQTFGNPISEYQSVQNLLADSAMHLYACNTVALDCARRIESGTSVRSQLAMVKAFTTESSFKALDNCMQVFGGMGFTNELGLYHSWHVARIARVADGSSEILRRTIARQLFKGDFDF